MALTSVSTVALMCAYVLGLLPHAQNLETHGRQRFCESLAVSCSLLAQRGDTAAIAQCLQVASQRNSDIASAVIRRIDGTQVAEVGDHQQFWELAGG